MVKTPKRTGQSFDLVVAAVTIESMGVTPPLELCHLLLLKSILDDHFLHMFWWRLL